MSGFVDNPNTVYKTTEEIAQPTVAATSCENKEICLADCLAFLRAKSPELANVVVNSGTLPKTLKSGILAMVQAACRGPIGD